MEYQPRIVDIELHELLATLPALALEGPRGVGKTATAERRAARVLRLDDDAVVEVAAADPTRFTAGPTPILIDEWQRVPASWDVVRRAVDDGAGAGSFLLTGSARPVMAPTHSGAGRIPTVRMRPMSFAERGLEQATIGLGSLLRDGAEVLGATSVGLAGYVDEIIRTGLPGIHELDGRARRVQLDGYLRRVVERDFPEQGLSVRRPTALRSWMQAYAAATSTTASYEAIRDASSAGLANPPARSTTQPYRDVLEQLWLVDPIEPWLPSSTPLRRLGQAPKHQFADPGLAARLLGVEAEALLAGRNPGPSIVRAGTLLGALFESLVALSVRVYAQSAEANVWHLRTHAGDHEIDLIVERADGSVLAIETKVGRTVGAEDTKHLRWLRSEIGDRFIDGVVITTGPDAYRRPDDGMAVVPLALLGH